MWPLLHYPGSEELNAGMGYQSGLFKPAEFAGGASGTPWDRIDSGEQEEGIRQSPRNGALGRLWLGPETTPPAAGSGNVAERLY